METDKRKLPEGFANILFYPDGQRELCIISGLSFEEGIQSVFFYFDLADCYCLNGIKPWEKPEEFIPRLMDLYKNRLSKKLFKLFSDRNRKEAKEQMIWSISYFLDVLFWANGKAVKSLRDIEDGIANLSVKPINARERLGFVMASPGQYHSYVQLNELFIEMEKLFIKSLLLKKRTPADW